ncbi:hypothetical protein PGT21_032468 [Puccinia graminis f. sp. tritici]|uniref:Uncharacterized protein n=2 Tax=Puccinia graminis f. sp. tritici TaxID=56615 RepID=E3L463_PUCGT|nr:uncharacterized protein PGTG_16992 [Puccinia graminis f. sp. tritici CRL 75-36-700-3]EFP91338.2 hypothetical protein PGTG_16992 [Puccinia graminis f. sp. tritici CRL 75-36-700-3]KAA1113487.1 hypothetical protein PGT21_032468 [Puccinia graminis f. sp. tritici]
MPANKKEYPPDGAPEPPIGPVGLGYVLSPAPRLFWPIKPPGKIPKPWWHSAKRDF